MNLEINYQKLTDIIKSFYKITKIKIIILNAIYIIPILVAMSTKNPSGRIFTSLLILTADGDTSLSVDIGKCFDFPNGGICALSESHMYYSPLI